MTRRQTTVVRACSHHWSKWVRRFGVLWEVRTCKTCGVTEYRLREAGLDAGRPQSRKRPA